jgi:biopolymer transport protein ExbB/TolQ
MIEWFFNALTALGPEWVMWILLALSVLSLAVALERYTAIRKHDRRGNALWNDLVEKWVKYGLKSDWRADAEKAATQYACLEGEILRLVSTADQKNSDVSKMVDSFIDRMRLKLDRYTSFLGTVGSNAPFIGLLGTVLGIIKAFHGMGGNIEAASQNISSGIAEALVSTAVGLGVAIPAVVAYNFFQRKIETIITRAQSLSQLLLSSKS